jgi:hypothetical protein
MRNKAVDIVWLGKDFYGVFTGWNFSWDFFKRTIRDLMRKILRNREEKLKFCIKIKLSFPLVDPKFSRRGRQFFKTRGNQLKYLCQLY